MKNEQQTYFKEDSCVEINPETKKVKTIAEEGADTSAKPVPEIFY